MDAYSLQDVHQFPNPRGTTHRTIDRTKKADRRIARPIPRLPLNPFTQANTETVAWSDLARAAVFQP